MPCILCFFDGVLPSWCLVCSSESGASRRRVIWILDLNNSSDRQCEDIHSHRRGHPVPCAHHGEQILLNSIDYRCQTRRRSSRKARYREEQTGAILSRQPARVLSISPIPRLTAFPGIPNPPSIDRYSVFMFHQLHCLVSTPDYMSYAGHTAVLICLC